MTAESFINQVKPDKLYVVTLDFSDKSNNDLKLFSERISMDVAQREARDEVAHTDAREAVVISTRRGDPWVIYQVWFRPEEGMEYYMKKEVHHKELSFVDWVSQVS
jgi:hypothetical protein